MAKSKSRSFRSFNDTQRAPARAMEPVLDPAGWSPESLDDVEGWSYQLTGADSAELIEATESIQRNAISPEDVSRTNFPLHAFAEILRDVRHELLDGRGIVMLQNFPVEQLDRQGQIIAYLGLGSYLGRPMSQNMQGHILGHVKDLGGDYADPRTRGYLTRNELRFHSDACDYVGLLCLQTPMSGGASLVASSVTVYNRLLERRPDLVEVLAQDFHRSRTGDVNPGDEAWFKQPVFSFNEGYLSAIGAGAGIDKAVGLPGVPPMSQAQKDAIRLYREVAAECAAAIPFRRGDVQFLNNWVTLHSRRAYEDWPEAARKRHLLRLWLSDPDGRPVPKEQREGRAGRGVLPAGMKLNAPFDVQGIA